MYFCSLTARGTNLAASQLGALVPRRKDSFALSHTNSVKNGKEDSLQRVCYP